MSGKTSLNLSENIEGLLCYAFGWISGLVLLIIEKESKFVRFHALQSVIWFGALSVLSVVLGILSRFWIIGWLFGIVGWLLGILTFASWVFLMFKAFNNEKFKIPAIGDAVDEQINK